MSAPVRQPHPCTPGPGLTEHTREPKVMVPPPNDHDADEAAGWAGVVDGPRGNAPLSR